MSLTLAFDVYGTLIDTQGVVTALEKLVGDSAREFSQMWREKQLEYSFRRGLMDAYVDFSVCTAQALEYTSRCYQFSFTDSQRKALLDGYSALPPFADVTEGLSQLRGTGICLYAFSNGRADAVEQLLENAQIRRFFLGIVSCDEIGSFKPDPAVYAHFLGRSESSGSDTWLVSSNPFDVIGAISAGWRAAWVQRSSSAVFDPWGVEPTVTISHLGELHGILAATPP